MKRRNGLLLLLAAGLMTFAYSCRGKITNKELKDVMGDYYKRKLIFPRNLPLINREMVAADNAVSLGDAGGDSSWLILHYLSADCDKCVNGLLTAGTFIDRNRDKFKHVKYVFVASGASDVYIKDAIAKANFKYPVYYEDKFLLFKVTNKLPLEDDLYNTMLLNGNREIILFGGFFDNARSQEILKEIVN